MTAWWWTKVAVTLSLRMERQVSDALTATSRPEEVTEHRCAKRSVASRSLWVSRRCARIHQPWRGRQLVQGNVQSAPYQVCDYVVTERGAKSVMHWQFLITCRLTSWFKELFRPPNNRQACSDSQARNINAMDFTNGEFADNISRAKNLISASKQLEGSSAESARLSHDVLRAAVVFLHASLEEVIRNLYVQRLPNSSPDHLSQIPLITDGASSRSAKFMLGDLVPFRGEFVENVIIKSVEAYVDTFNLNNATQLANCLELAELPTEPLRQHFSALHDLMQRRHQIVHQMDRSDELDPLTVPLSSIDALVVERWAQALEDFVNDLFVLHSSEK